MPDYELVFVIEDKFNLSQCGLVVVSRPDCGWDPRMKQTVLLKFPNGEKVKTTARAMLSTPPSQRVSLNLEELKPEDVPIGTEVWAEKQPN